MYMLEGIYHERKEHEEALKWAAKGAEAGLPKTQAEDPAVGTGRYCCTDVAHTLLSRCCCLARHWTIT